MRIVRTMCLMAVVGLTGLSQIALAASSSPELATYQEPAMPATCEQNALSLSECAGQLRDSSESYLKELVSRMGKAMSKQRGQAFYTAQEAWKKFAIASCDFDAADANGNSKAALHTTCMHSYNNARISMLYAYFRCSEEASCRGGKFLYQMKEAASDTRQR